MKNILFVCTGNSCRSVIAEGLLRYMTKGSEHEFSVGSAGVSALDGYQATQSTVRAMQEAGIDVLGHRSRRLTQEMVNAADKIFVMENMHKMMVLDAAPGACGKVHLLKEFASEKGAADMDIPDPIRMSDAFYRKVLLEIRDCVVNIIQSL